MQELMNPFEQTNEETLNSIERAVEAKSKDMTPEQALAWVVKASANYRKNRKEFYDAIDVARKICFARKMIIDGRKLGWNKFVEEVVTSQGGPTMRTIDLNLKKIGKEQNRDENKDAATVRLETLNATLPTYECPTFVRAMRRENLLDVVLWVPRLNANVPVTYKIA
jgi:hypothetical protein